MVLTDIGDTCHGISKSAMNGTGYWQSQRLQLLAIDLERFCSRTNPSADMGELGELLRKNERRTRALDHWQTVVTDYVTERVKYHDLTNRVTDTSSKKAGSVISR